MKSSETPPPRRRRADAERSRAAILDAAIRVLGERPGATVESMAVAAGVTRQTVYAHYPSREELLAAVVARATGEAVAAMDDAHLDEGSAADALLRLLDVSWRTFERYPVLLHADAAPAGPQEERDQHGPVADRLGRLIRRGQETGEFDRQQSPDWLVATTIALGHAAGGEVVAGRMTGDQAAAALRVGVLRVFGVVGA
ncbi:TetR/AcrR family transcriptional regulator [Streptomyces sp. SYSU K21746]